MYKNQYYQCIIYLTRAVSLHLNFNCNHIITPYFFTIKFTEDQRDEGGTPKSTVLFYVNNLDISMNSFYETDH